MNRKKKKDLLILILLIIALFAINYNFLDNSIKNFLSDSEIVEIERIVDGDTLIANGNSIRLLGINTPEKGEIYYDQAKQYLEKLALNKTARLEFGKDKKDRYNRTLAYIYINGQNINLELVKKGYANIYFPSGKDNHYNEFLNSWVECVDNNINLCEKSTNICATNCIQLKGIEIQHQRIYFYNRCERSCEMTSWSIKDEGRKKFIFPNYSLPAYSNVSISVNKGSDFYWDEPYVWTSTGDSMFLRDKENKLVLWKNY